MSYDYAEEAALAVEMIAEFGRDVTLIAEVNEGSRRDPDIRRVPTPAKTVVTSYRSSQIDGSLIQMGDRLYLFDATTPVTTDMRVLDGDGDYAIQSVEPVRLGEPVVLYKCQVRG